MPPAQQAEPIMGDSLATGFVALTTLIMAYGSLFGFVSILVFYAMWLPRLSYKGALTITPDKDTILLLLFPLYACLSALWSLYPSISIYNAGEYASLVACTLIMSRIVTTRAFIRGVVLGCVVTLIASLLADRYGIDPLTGDYALIGLFGSKNQVGLFAEIGIFMALLGFLFKQKLVEKLFYCHIPLLLCGVSLYLSKSASSVLSLGVTLAVLGLIVIIARLPRTFRLFTFLFMAIWLAALVGIGLALDWHEAIFQSFGKDSTLTGRTVLWENGMKEGWERPVLGHGYGAFWVQGYAPAERLWYMFRMFGRGGFHFHNVYVQVFVEIGLIGVLLIVMLMWRNCARSLALALRHGIKPEYALALGLSVMLLIRSMVEVDIIGTFGIGAILFYSVIPRLALESKKKPPPTGAKEH